MLKLLNSPVSSFKFDHQTYYVKRDDLLSPLLNGNKARKLASLITQPPRGLQNLISFGGDQSNLMYALSALAKLKHWQFTYYIRNLSPLQRQQPAGNLAASLANGMELVELGESFKLRTQQLQHEIQPFEYLIKQGGAQIEAEFGMQQLAQEIISWARDMNFADLAVFVASGTGTTALYLQKHLVPFTVYTTNCVGSEEYLLQQFAELSEVAQPLPIIFPNNRFRFARPYPELYQTIQQINSCSQIEFDLVYDPVGWQILRENSPKIAAPILYLHCGGTLGNLSMLQRYAAI